MTATAPEKKRATRAKAAAGKSAAGKTGAAKPKAANRKAVNTFKTSGASRKSIKQWSALSPFEHRRLSLLMEGVNLHITDDPGRAAYYIELDIMAEAEHFESKEFAEYLDKNYEPTDIVFRLAHQSSVVLLNGGGFDGPQWSIRVSLANLDDLDDLKIGHHVHAILEEYRDEWQSSKA